MCMVRSIASLPALDRARKSRTHSSAGERSLHTGEVQGSIPCASTIFRPCGTISDLSFKSAPQLRHCERSEATVRAVSIYSPSRILTAFLINGAGFYGENSFLDAL